MLPNLSINSFKISAVIASIGGVNLRYTIENLNRGTIVPDEIIVVVPDEFKSDIPLISCSNLHIEIVPFKGQVAQRSHGFKLVKNEFVLQLDDDIKFADNCLEVLLRALVHLGPSHSVGPMIFYLGSNLPAFSLGVGLKKFFLDFKSYFFSGSLWGSKRMGKISKNGVGFGFDYNYLTTDINYSEWLAGGCILHYGKGVIFDNYFPFEGKAYGEDLIHSHYLNRSGIKLYNIRNAHCFIEIPLLNENNYSLYNDFRSRIFLNILRSESVLQTYIWYFIKKALIFFK
jgi:hypothetical protein